MGHIASECCAIDGVAGPRGWGDTSPLSAGLCFLRVTSLTEVSTSLGFSTAEVRWDLGGCVK